jgi:hypothetical protein
MSIINGETFSAHNCQLLFSQESFTGCSVNLNPLALDSYSKTNTYSMLAQNTLNNYDFEVDCTTTYEGALKHIASQFKEYVHYNPNSYGFSEKMNGTTPKANPLEYEFRTADVERWAGNKIIDCEGNYASLCIGCGTGGGTLCTATIEESIIGKARDRFSEADWTSLCDECYEEDTTADNNGDNNDDNDDFKGLDSTTSCSSLNRKGGACCPCGDCLSGYMVDNREKTRCIKTIENDDNQMLIVGSIVGVLALALLIKR